MCTESILLPTFRAPSAMIERGAMADGLFRAFNIDGEVTGGRF